VVSVTHLVLKICYGGEEKNSHPFAAQSPVAASSTAPSDGFSQTNGGPQYFKYLSCIPQ
jgi:hypothetical protein